MVLRAKIRKTGGKINQFIPIDAVNAGDKAGVLRTRKIAMKRPGKAHWPRDGAVTPDFASAWGKCARNQPKQGRFSGPVTAQKGDGPSSWKHHIGVVQNGFHGAIQPKRLAKVVQGDHRSAPIAQRIINHRGD